MKRRLLILILLVGVLMAVLGGAFTVTAAETEEAGETNWPHAEGDGLVFLRGTGWVRIHEGDGVLWVKGAEQIHVTGYGHREEFPDGWVEYCGINGSARIRGREISVIIAGNEVTLDAVGHGRVHLWGKGRYRVGGTSPVAWDAAPGPVTY